MDKIKGNILVVDDDEEMCRLLSDVLTEGGHSVRSVTSSDDAMAVLQNPLDLVITDLRLKGMEGLELMHRIKKSRPELFVIIITAFGSIESAIEAMKRGAYDYIPKPFKMDELLLVVQKALREGALHREVARLRSEINKEYRFENIIGKSKSMQTIFDLIKRVSSTSANILIVGESGTGKELVAKAIHYNSPRKGHPFVPVNCAAIPDALLESEMFGHVRGAFTDAKSDKPGLFEEASGGTLFLDEISEVPMMIQAKLLRAVQERDVRRVGSNRIIKIDTRIIVASNLDLAEEVKQHRFRDDLFYRLNVIQIVVPPLRERRDDIIRLVYYFFDKFKKESEKAISGISESVLSILLDYYWPGNVRELENAIERAVILSQGDQILPEDLPSSISGSRDEFSMLEEALDKQITLEDLSLKYIERVLEKTGGNKYRTAQILGIDRKTLYRKMKQLHKDSNPDSSP